MTRFFKFSLPALLLIGVIAACEKEYETIEVIDDRNVKAYIQQNNLNVTEFNDTGIYYQIVNPGSGPDMEYSDKIPVILTLKSLDGKYASTDTLLASNRYYNFLGYFNPEGLRVGIKELLKKKSGTIRMIIPSRLAFGRNGAGNIPGNASLDITARVLEPTKMGAYEDFVIKQYLAANNMTGFTRSPKGTYYKIEAEGTGSPITVDSTITAEYTGKLLNGTVFDRTTTTASTFTLSGLVDGWREIVPMIKQGGSVRMIMPSSQGYGFEGNSSIPPFSQLDFAVKVTDVSP